MNFSAVTRLRRYFHNLHPPLCRGCPKCGRSSGCIIILRPGCRVHDYIHVHPGCIETHLSGASLNFKILSNHGGQFECNFIHFRAVNFKMFFNHGELLSVNFQSIFSESKQSIFKIFFNHDGAGTERLTLGRTCLLTDVLNCIKFCFLCIKLTSDHI